MTTTASPHTGPTPATGGEGRGGRAARIPRPAPDRIEHWVSLISAGSPDTPGAPEPFEAVSPLDDEPVARIPESTTADIDAAFDRARRAQQRWADTPVRDRARLLSRFHTLVLAHRTELTDLVVLESGKARKHAADEVVHVAMTARYYAATAERTLATSRRAGVMRGLTKVRLRHTPKGVVGVISPWNYPLTLAVSDGLAALMAGNAVVLKPDARTMLCALAAADLLHQAGFDPDLWQVVAGPGSTVGPAVVDRADYVCFTGSTKTGTEVAHRAADRLIGASLELSGKNPMIVLDDADIERAAEGAVRACFSSGGQLCVSIERIYIVDSAYDAFEAAFRRRVEAMHLGDPMSWSSDMGSLISAQQLATLRSHIDDALANGAKILAGGHPRPDLGPYMHEPTVLTGVREGMLSYGDETFGPLVALYRVADTDEAIARANTSDRGLNASVYGRDTTRAEAVASRIRCGSVNVNEGFTATFASLDAPMGGMGGSGLGRRQSTEGILRFTEPQTVATQRLHPLAPPPGVSAKTFADALFLHERVMKAVRAR